MNDTELLLSSQANANRLLDSIAELDRLKNKRRIELLRYRCALLKIRVEKYVAGSQRRQFATKRLRHSMANIANLRDELEDAELTKIVMSRNGEPRVQVNLDEL